MSKSTSQKTPLRYSLAQAMGQKVAASARTGKKFSLAEAMRKTTGSEPSK